MKEYFHPTESQLEKVKIWLHDGKSRTQIAARLGVTKGVIDGMVWRSQELMALAPHKPGYGGKPAYPRRTSRMITKSLEPPPMDDVADEPPKQGKMLKDLGFAECKYPVSYDPEAVGGWLFCARKTKPDQIYCEKHRQRIRQAKTEGTTR